MKKETVTSDKIKADILNYCTYDLKKLAFPFIFTLLWAIVLIILILAIPMPRPLVFVKIIIICRAVSTLLITTIYLFKKMKNIIRIKKIAQSGQFKITTDTLESAYVNYHILSTIERWFMITGTTRKLYKPYFLKFSENGDYALPMCEIYTWSSECKMSGGGIFSSAKKGDKFYLVKNNDEIIMVYNADFFLTNVLQKYNKISAVKRGMVL